MKASESPTRTCGLALSALVALSAWLGCGRSDTHEDVLAVVGPRRITVADFVERYRYFRSKTGEGVPDTYEARRKVLAAYVDEQALLLEAERRGYPNDPEGRHERARIEIQELLNLFTREAIAANVRVSEDELKRLFVRLNTRLKARHLYAPTKAEADSLYARLRRGATFEELARSVFRDPRLRDSGGLLGTFSVDEMEPEFEEAAYRLRVGEVSQPVRTRDGWSIIRVDDRVTKPLLTETEYARHRGKLYAYWRNRKIKQAMQAFSDSVGRKLDIVFNESTLDALYRLRRSAPESPGPQEARRGEPDALADQELLRSRLGTWTVATFRQKARFTSDSQRRWIRSKEHFREFIAGLVVRDHILNEARQMGLHRRSEYLQNVAKKMDDYLYDRMMADLKRELVVPEDSLRRYYEADPSRFAAPPQIRLREIVLRDADAAGETARALAQGADFAELARRVSVRRWSAERDGDLGFLTPQDLGRWADRLFRLRVGERTEPLLMDSLYVILECTARKPERVRPFEEVRPQVVEALKFTWWDEYYAGRVASFRRKAGRLAVYPEKLKTIRLN